MTWELVYMLPLKNKWKGVFKPHLETWKSMRLSSFAAIIKADFRKKRKQKIVMVMGLKTAILRVSKKWEEGERERLLRQIARED